MLTNKNLILSRTGFSGMQHLYRVGNWGLSVVNGSNLHSYPFAWEAAVILFEEGGTEKFILIYDTPLTSDVEVFMSDKETNEFLKTAFEFFTENPISKEDAANRCETVTRQRRETMDRLLNDFRRNKSLSGKDNSDKGTQKP